MAERIHWLRDLQDGPWSGIADAMRKGIPVPDGFVVRPETPEREIRDAYEELKTKEHTHYVAVRGGIRAQLDVIGPDRLIHSLRESWNESPGGERLIQAMINAAWSGNARRDHKGLRISAAEGLLCLDPDVYLMQGSSAKTRKRTLYQQPRKVFRGVDGRTRTMEIIGERKPLESKYLEAIQELAERVGTDITWKLDDRGIWLVGTEAAA